jgi:hypothetical protein
MGRVSFRGLFEVREVTPAGPILQAAVMSWHHRGPMRRLVQAPNLAIATLWADLLQREGGFDVSVQRAFASGIAGEIPPDQALPELWIHDDGQRERALALLDRLRHLPHHHWHCLGCGESVDGPFEQCWNCGAAMPGGRPS